MRQRLGLAAALLHRPRLLILDEPTNGLDPRGIRDVRDMLTELNAEGVTVFVSSHLLTEIEQLCTRVGVMDAGRLDQVATPRDLYETPASRWIAEFVGDINLFEGQVEPAEQGRLAVVTRDAGTIYVAEPRTPLSKNVVSVAIRPEKVKLSRRAPAADGTSATAFNRLEGVITDVSYLGGLTTDKVKLDSGAMVRSSMANTTRILDAYAPSQRVVAWFTPDDCLVLEQ
jgi:putrescine transport system ATP-binding protein